LRSRIDIESTRLRLGLVLLLLFFALLITLSCGGLALLLLPARLFILGRTLILGVFGFFLRLGLIASMLVGFSLGLTKLFGDIVVFLAI
jgi:hypothetical protein